MIKNTPKSVLIGWTTLAVSALAAYTFSKDYTMNRLKTYTKENSVTSSGGHEQEQVAKEGAPLRRSVNRSL
ncbi:hypothetical protein INT47_001918 [Mucor saturninus]|uniref:Uncharacterized protein n=1 Tax=Mucor saturninus TaxID=64648 RepID=A0A8H7RFX9_9FUNG|nr:hypothetical protein INT47_001918 [Mucor saturninus]